MARRSADLSVDAIAGKVWRISKNGEVRRAGWRDSRGYWYVMVNGNRQSLHRMIWEHINGEIPHRLEIDHIDGDPSNNSILNLRLVTHALNMQNRHNAHSSSRSGVKGVSWDNERGKWCAQIRAHGIVIKIGRFDTAEAAAAAYAEGAGRHHTHNPHAKKKGLPKQTLRGSNTPEEKQPPGNTGSVYDI